MERNLNYGQALQALSEGKIVAREGWNAKGIFVFKQIPAEIGLDIIPKMQSVPQAVKDRMIKTNTTLKHTNQMGLVQPNGRVDSWVASSSDTFANDWYILIN